jgi:predicted RNA polymerase sigma factor
MDDQISEKLLRICTWCNREIPSESDAFGFGATASQKIDLTEQEGKFVSLQLALSDKTVVALVPRADSSIRKDGFDLVFVTCSPDCAEELKRALELERDVLEDKP